VRITSCFISHIKILLEITQYIIVNDEITSRNDLYPEPVQVVSRNKGMNVLVISHEVDNHYQYFCLPITSFTPIIKFVK